MLSTVDVISNSQAPYFEVPEKGIRGKVQNPGAWQPGMLGETYLNVFLA